MHFITEMPKVPVVSVVNYRRTERSTRLPDTFLMGSEFPISTERSIDCTSAARCRGHLRSPGEYADNCSNGCPFSAAIIYHRDQREPLASRDKVHATTMWKFADPIKIRFLKHSGPRRKKRELRFCFSQYASGDYLESRTWVPAMVPGARLKIGFVTPDNLDWYRRFAEGQPGHW